MNLSLIFMFAGILTLGAILFAIITFSRSGARRLDVQKYRSLWLKVEQQLQKDNPASFSMAILNADKLLDLALREKNVKGRNLGERLKNIRWHNANSVWAAHKLRNKIAHEPEVKVDYNLSRRALASFKQALKDLGAI